MSESVQDLLKKAQDLLSSKEYASAEKLLKEIIKNSSLDSKQGSVAHHLLSLTYFQTKQLNEALDHAKKACEMNPDDANNQNLLGILYVRHNDTKAAEKCFRKVLELNPNFAAAWEHITYCKKYTDASDPDIKKIEDLLRGKNNKVPPSQKYNLFYALGKIHDDLKNYEKAVTSYFQANFLKDARFDSAGIEIEYQMIEKNLTKEVIKRFDRQPIQSEITPVFIVGMARSGTTLLEQILAAHSKVHPLGEYAVMKNIINYLPRHISKVNDPWARFQSLTQESLGTQADHYLKAITKNAPEGKLFYVNKTPSNFMYVGFIKMLFPNAKVIHIRRHPGDTGVSCFFQNFAIGNGYSFDAAHLGYFYRRYVEIMDYWHEVMDDDFIFELKYEDLVNDPKSNIKKVLKFCGLKWEDACLEHEKVKRFVDTASQLQVIKPIYQSSVGRWEHYRPWLRDLFNLEDIIKKYER